METLALIPVAWISLGAINLCFLVRQVNGLIKFFIVALRVMNCFALLG